jgi:hypothetical protein
LDRGKRRQLNALFALNRRILKAYLLKESLSHLWDYRYEGAMLRYLQKWIDQFARAVGGSWAMPMTAFPPCFSGPSMRITCRHQSKKGSAQQSVRVRILRGFLTRIAAWMWNATLGSRGFETGSPAIEAWWARADGYERCLCRIGARGL